MSFYTIYDITDDDQGVPVRGNFAQGRRRYVADVTAPTLHEANVHLDRLHDLFPRREYAAVSSITGRFMSYVPGCDTNCRCPADERITS